MVLCRLLCQRKRRAVASYKLLSTAAVPMTAASRAVLSSSWWVRCGTSSSDQLESHTALEKQVGYLRIAQFWKANALYYIVCARFRVWTAVLINTAASGIWSPDDGGRRLPRDVCGYIPVHTKLYTRVLYLHPVLYLRLVSKFTWLSALQAYTNRVKDGSRPGRRWNNSNAGTFLESLVQTP